MEGYPMYPKHVLAAALVMVLTYFFPSRAAAQNPPAHAESVPIYKVTVIGRTVSAVNYQYRNGPTMIDFRGTVLQPHAKGEAIVESKAGRTEIDVHFEHLTPSQQFGAEYLTYVLWALTPEGHVKNLGEVLANGSDKAHTHVTTDLQAFGLIVTAEPYSAGRLPSDVVVLENQVRPDTLGGTEPIQARYELMPRGTYTYNVPAGLGAAGPRVSMAEYEKTLQLYQALNAIQIAAAQGAAQYAPDVYEKARQQYEKARQLQVAHADRSAVVTAARDAAQTAEDARTLATARKHDAELASAHADTEREQQLRIRAEADAHRAQSEAAAAQAQAVAADNQLQSERNARSQTGARTTASSIPTASAVERPASIQYQPDGDRTALRARLLSKLSGPLETLDSGRGVIVAVPDSGFRETALTPDAANNLARVATAVMSQPGLLVEVDGNSDEAGPSAERFSLDRATAVKDALIRAGLPADRITARGLGNSHPFGSNATAKGREDNRRVEVVVHGDVIGSAASWDKAYSLNPGH
jgi:outer membrane protein OmpA-like peptidoglycan-associated protein